MLKFQFYFHGFQCKWTIYIYNIGLGHNLNIE